MVLRRPSEPTHLHGGRSSRESGGGQVATPAGFDFVPANHSTRVRRRVRCVDRLRKIPSGAGPPGRYRQGLAGIRAPFQLALHGRDDNLSRVLDGQRSLFSAELTLAEARGTEYQSLVQLYRVLGGGWQ